MRPGIGGAAASGRQDSYKNKALFKQDELRRRREEAQVENRRQKREESMAKRRNMDVNPSDLTDGETDDEPTIRAPHSSASSETMSLHSAASDADSVYTDDSRSEVGEDLRLRPQANGYHHRDMMSP